MKKVLLSILFTGFVTAGSYAQPKSVLVYGDLGVSSHKTENDDKTFGFRINPGIGYQFDKYWTVGLTGSFNTDRSRSSRSREWDYYNSYSAGLFVRNTFPVSRIFFVFSQLEGGYIGGAKGNTGTNTTENTNGFYARLTPAVGIFVGHGFALNFGFGGISYQTSKLSGAAKANSSFDLTWGTQFNIGVSKNLRCGHHKYGPRKYRQGRMHMNKGSKVMREDFDNDDEPAEDND